MELPKERNIATEPFLNDERQPNDTKRDLGLFERLGTRLLAANAATFALMLVSVVFLVYLWFGDHENTTWRHIMLGAWIGQAVTLCSIAVRLAIGTQASTAVAFMASISLESSGNSGVLVEQAHALSLARCVNTGPMASLCLFWRNIYQKRDRSVLALVTLLAITSFVAQFTSTLLLWDIQSGDVQGFPTASRIPFGGLVEDYVERKIGRFQETLNYWASATTEYPTFAEWPLQPDTLPDHVRDTGPTVRAFLPIRSSEERSAITEYAGPASLFDARVGTYLKHQYFTGKLEPWMTGDINDALVSHNSSYFFNCTLTPLDEVSRRPLYKVCGLPSEAGGLISSLDPTQNIAISHTYDERWWANLNGNGKSWPIELGHAVLIMGASFLRDDWSSPYSYGLDLAITEKRGPWLDFISSGREGVRYHSEVRDRVKHLQEFPIVATKRTNQSEPKLSWNIGSGIFDTKELRSQLDKKYNSTKGRAVMNLNLTNAIEMLQEHISTWGSNWDGGIKWSRFEYRGQYTVNPFNCSTNPARVSRERTMDFLNVGVWSHLQTTQKHSYSIRLRNFQNVVGPLVAQPSDIVSTELHYIIDGVIQEILEETDNPALAWQALTTFVMRSVYYDRLPTFSAEDTVNITRVLFCTIPVKHAGFIIAMINMLVHHALVIATLVWFICLTKYSRINCAWQAVAQIKAPETEELLEKATIANDDMVKKWVEEDENLRGRKFKIRLEPENGRVCLS